MVEADDGRGHLARVSGTGKVAARDMAMVVAHSDDETIGIGGQLPRLQDVVVIHVTDGAPRNLEDARRAGFASAADYAACRRRELEAAVALAGMVPSSLRSLDVPDQEASLDLVGIARRIAACFRDQSAACVVTHAFEGGHPDHDATAFCVHVARRLLRREGGDVTILEMPFYRSEGGGMVRQSFVPYPNSPELEVRLSAAQQRLKRAMLDAHASQRSVIEGFSVDVERFRVAPDYDFGLPPNGGDILYERHPWGMTGARWRELATAALRELDAS
jgi:LmbE family N-acetylglucosaminyl deacetylase